MAQGAVPILETVDSLKPCFEAGLFLFLENLYDRGGHPTVGSIYGKYNASLVQREELDDVALCQELITLLNGFTKIGATCYLQTGPVGYEELNLGVNYNCYIKGVAQDADGVETFDDLVNCVYWFQKPNAANAERRVYIHLAQPLAAPGIAVLKVLVPLLNTIAGFQKIKMFGPVAGINRNDSIVVYCTDKDAQRQIAAIAAALNPAFFLDDLPNWVKRIGRGVGIADEPPNVPVFAGDNDKPSFGKFLSKLIWVAWSKRKDGSKVEFLRLMLIALQTAHINPLKPHRHSRKAEVEAMAPGLDQALQAALTL